MTTLAVARDMREPTKADVGIVTEESNSANERPSLPDLLAKSVPVGLITAYTAFIAAVAELTAPDDSGALPNQLWWLRWMGFGVLVVGSALLTYASYRQKAGAERPRFPLLEIAAVTVAAAAWGLAIPSSPLLVMIEDAATGAGVVALVAFAGVVTNSVLANLLQAPAGAGVVQTQPRPQTQG